MRDDHPFAGPAPPAAVFYASSDRRGEHPQRHLVDFSGILQADCYNGFSPLFDRPSIDAGNARLLLRPCAPEVLRAGRCRPQCPARQRGQADLAGARSAVKRIDALFAIERDINGLSAAERLAVRQEKSKPR